MIISLLEKEIPYIDVRAPIEFTQGALPTKKIYLFSMTRKERKLEKLTRNLEAKQQQN